MKENNNSNLAIINKTEIEALIMELQYLDQEVLSKLTDKSNLERLTTQINNIDKLEKLSSKLQDFFVKIEAIEKEGFAKIDTTLLAENINKVISKNANELLKKEQEANKSIEKIITQINQTFSSLEEEQKKFKDLIKNISKETKEEKVNIIKVTNKTIKDHTEESVKKIDNYLNNIEFKTQSKIDKLSKKLDNYKSIEKKALFAASFSSGLIGIAIGFITSSILFYFVK